MILLITTSKSLLTLDTETEKLSVIHTAMGLYYGITFSETEIFVAARNNDNPFDYLGKPDEQGVILVFNAQLQLTRKITAPFPLRDMHQIMFFDNKLWITCSADNMVAIYDGDEWQQWYPSPKLADRNIDINHFNSLWVKNNELHLLAHNLGREPSVIYRYNYPDKKLIETITLGNQAHNIWMLDNQQEYFSCDSDNGKVISSTGKKVALGGFPRGAVITETHYYIGTSDVAERIERDQVSSKIVQFNNDWHPIKTFTITGHGQLLDIKAPGINDIAQAIHKGIKLTD